MIKFFRHIRQTIIMENSKSARYFKYAIGEIILVVIGILIALQINNWDENRKSRIDEKATLSKFFQDLQTDSTYFQLNLSILNSIDKLHKDIYKIGVKDEKGVRLLEPNFIRRALDYNPIAKENHPDIISKVNNDNIREGIQNYYRQMITTEESHEEFENIVYTIRDFLRTRGAHNPGAWFEGQMISDIRMTNLPEIITAELLIELSKETYFQQLLLESSLKLNQTRNSLKALLQNNSELMSTIKNHLND